MLKKSKKVIALVLATALAFTAAAVAVPSDEAFAASTKKVYVTTKKVSDDGTTTKYKYNDMGLVSQVKAVTNVETNDTSAVTATSDSVHVSDTVVGSTTTSVDTGSYQIYGTRKVSRAKKTVTTTDYTYCAKGAKKGMLKKAVTTTTITGSYSDVVTTIADPTGKYAVENSGGYSYTKTITQTTTYSYTDGLLSKTVSTITEPAYYTYSNVTGKYLPEKIDATTQSKYLNTSNYADDKSVTTVTNTYTPKNDKIRSILSSVEIVDTDITNKVSEKAGVTTSNACTQTTTTTYDAVKTVNSYNKKGYIKKQIIKDPGTGKIVTRDEDVTKRSDSTLDTTKTETTTEPIKNRSSKTTVKYSYDRNYNVVSIDTSNTYSDYTATNWTNTASASSAEATATTGATQTDTYTLVNNQYLSITQTEAGTSDVSLTLKGTTGRIETKYTTVGKMLKSGEKNISADTTRTVYTIKRKTAQTKYSSKVEAQQWTISNDIKNYLTWSLL